MVSAKKASRDGRLNYWADIMSHGKRRLFYHSQPWKKARAAYLAYRKAIDGGLCEVCRDSVGKVVDCNDIMRIPLADVREKKRGKWLHPSKNIAKCSECGCARDIRDQFGWNFCPVCGAQMSDE